MVKCKNCGKIVIYKYCPHCGQRVEQRLTFATASADMLRGITNGDVGVLFTLKELFTRPGRMMAEYLDGKRVNHFRPFPLLILLTGFVALFDRWVETTDVTRKLIESSSGFSLDATPLKATFMVPFFALASWLLFIKKRKYNYIEHLYITAFATIQRQIIMFLLISIPSVFLPDDYKIIQYGVVVFVAFWITMWDYKQLFELTNSTSFWKTFWLFVISGLGFLFASSLLVAIIYLFGEIIYPDTI